MKQQPELPFTTEELGRTRKPLELTDAEVVLANAIRCCPTRILINKRSVYFATTQLDPSTTYTRLQARIRTLSGKIGKGTTFLGLVSTVRHPEFKYRLNKPLCNVNRLGMQYQIPCATGTEIV